MAAEHGQLADQYGAKPCTQFGERVPAKLVLGLMGGGECLLHEVARPTLGAQAGREFGVGDGQEEPAGCFEDIREVLSGGEIVRHLGATSGVWIVVVVRVG